MPSPGWTSASMPAPAGVTFLGPMAVARNSDGRLEIFALASDPTETDLAGDIYHASQLEATDGPARYAETGTVTIDGQTRPVFSLASADLWSDLATPLWTSLGRPPNGGVLVVDEGPDGETGLIRPQPVLIAAKDSLGHLILCVLGNDGSLYSRTQTAPASSSSWGPWMGSQPPGVPLYAEMAVATTGNSVFAFVVGYAGNTNQVFYYGQDGSGQPWEGPFPLGNPTANGYILYVTAAVDAAGGIMVIATIYYEGGYPNTGNFFANYLPQALNAAWSGWVALPNFPIEFPTSAILMQTTWASGALYLIASAWTGSSIFFLRYGLPPTIWPLGTQRPAWATEFGTVVSVPPATWAADSFDGPAPNAASPFTTAVFYVDTQDSLWMVGFAFTRPIGLNPPFLEPSAPVQIDSAASEYGNLAATLLPNMAVARNASGLWEVFCLQASACMRWTQSPPS
jgi:hypothetical protein